MNVNNFVSNVYTGICNLSEGRTEVFTLTVTCNKCNEIMSSALKKF